MGAPACWHLQSGADVLRDGHQRLPGRVRRSCCRSSASRTTPTCWQIRSSGTASGSRSPSPAISMVAERHSRVRAGADREPDGPLSKHLPHDRAAAVGDLYVVTYLIFRWILNADLGLLNAFFVEVLGWPRDPVARQPDAGDGQPDRRQRLARGAVRDGAAAGWPPGHPAGAVRGRRDRRRRSARARSSR